MSLLADLPTMATWNATHGAPKKGLPPALVKEEKQKAKADKDEAFRKAVWKRDGGKSRATGRKLSKSGLDWNCVGEVDHVINRSTAPDPVHHMLEVSGPDDRAKPQLFLWRDKDGREINRRNG